MTEVREIKTNCRFCGYQCGLLATVKKGKVLAVKPDPSRFPNDEKIMNGCRRWRQALNILDHPDRINYPLKRVGRRGSGQWERITWEQALDEIADKLRQLKEQYGPETLATSIGGPHTTFWPLHRFLSLFGSPNNVGIGQICWNPGIWVNTLTFGWPLDLDFSPEATACLMLWGINPAESDNSLLWRTILQYGRDSNPIIVVDPRRTRTAERAKLWLPVRPGTDPILALGLINVIIAEDLYDREFVHSWCHGFEALCEHVKKYTPAYVAEKTGVGSEKIIEAARLFAKSKPAALHTGRGIDQLGPNSVPTHRAIAILKAITGNVDVPGATHVAEMPDFIPELDFELSEKFPQVYEKQLNKGKLVLQSYQGFQRVRELTLQHNKRLPMRYLNSAHPNLVWKAMISGEPYPIRAMIVMASDPLLTQADTKLIYKALTGLDLLVALELFQTPTSLLADYVLPSAGILERPLLETNAGTSNIAYGGREAVEPYYERKPDYYFWKELGCRLGQQEYWPWETYTEALASTFEPIGLSWEDFCETGLYCSDNEYYKHEKIDPATGKPQGFATLTRKVELYSETLNEMGCDPLPVPQRAADTTEEYPLLLITGARYQPYYASSYHQIKEYREIHPDPIAEINEETASALGLKEGDFILVETERGKARFKLNIRQMADDVVSVEYGWWYPEMDNTDPVLGGLWLSNANILTNADIETSDRLVGTWTYNGIPCRVSKLTEQSGLNKEKEE
mgnify:CR=1 FL=1